MKLKLFGTLLTVAVLAALTFSVIETHKILAQSAAGYTLVYSDYFCDPATATKAQPCPEQERYTKYVDPVLGSAKTYTNIQHPLELPFTMLEDSSGTTWVEQEVNGYYTIKHRSAGTPPADCAASNTTYMGDYSMLGYVVKQYRLNNANGTPHMIWWNAPALNCESLRLENHFSDGAVTYQITSKVLLGKPSPSVFQIPAGFASMSPIQLEQTKFVNRATAAGTSPTEALALWQQELAGSPGLSVEDKIWHNQNP